MPLTITKVKTVPGHISVQYRDPVTLIPYPDNAKLHPAQQIEALAKSMRDFKFDVPVVVDGDGMIIKGHGRREAAIAAGIRKVPVIVRNDLTPEQIRAARIADNKLAETDWDMERLAAELQALEELQFPIEDLGFSEHELEAFLHTEDFDDLEVKHGTPNESDFYPLLKLTVTQEDKAVFESLMDNQPGEHEWDKFHNLLAMLSKEAGHGIQS